VVNWRRNITSVREARLAETLNRPGFTGDSIS